MHGKGNRFSVIHPVDNLCNCWYFVIFFSLLTGMLFQRQDVCPCGFQSSPGFLWEHVPGREKGTTWKSNDLSNKDDRAKWGCRSSSFKSRKVYCWNLKSLIFSWTSAAGKSTCLVAHKSSLMSTTKQATAWKKVLSVLDASGVNSQWSTNQLTVLIVAHLLKKTMSNPLSWDEKLELCLSLQSWNYFRLADI